MATDRQIEANRRNASRSSGPKSPEGKARSRANATRHGLAGESADIEAAFSPEFEERRAKWAAGLETTGEPEKWALDRAVAATLRIERCERAMDDLVATTKQRAALTWVEDRSAEASTVFARLDREPAVVSRQLQMTLPGVLLLIDAWFALVEAFESGRDWSESECCRAQDLLGVDLAHRDARSPIDPPEGTDPVSFHRELALEELDRLEALRVEALAPLDDLERRQAMKGDITLLSKPAKLLLRYERDAWKRYRESMKQVKAPAPTSTPPPVVETPPAPPLTEPPQPPEPPSTPPEPSIEEQRRALLAEAAPFRLEVTNRLTEMGFADEDAWLDELERRLELPRPARSFVATERTQFGGILGDPSPREILE